MIHGVILLGWIRTAISVLFVAADIRSTPESPVLKWGFVLVTDYTGPFGAFFYVLGCREPLTGLHERYVAGRGRQVLGSAMHCVAGDGAGILAGAVIGGVLRLSAPAHVALEYFLGFGFGWSIFQALFLRDMAGGSFARSLRGTFISEFLSMNTRMGGMVAVMMILRAEIPGSDSPREGAFWLVMSMALLCGAVVAYPMNWWLVAHQLKHGMMTVRKVGDAKDRVPTRTRGMTMDHKAMAEVPPAKPSAGTIAAMALLSMVIFAAGIAVARIFG